MSSVYAMFANQIFIHSFIQNILSEHLKSSSGVFHFGTIHTFIYEDMTHSDVQ